MPSLPRVLPALHALYKELVPKPRAANIHISSAEEVWVKIGLQKLATTLQTQPSCINYFSELNTFGLWLSQQGQGRAALPRAARACGFPGAESALA